MKTGSIDPMLAPTSRMRVARQLTIWGLVFRGLIILGTLGIMAIGTYGVFR